MVRGGADGGRGGAVLSVGGGAEGEGVGAEERGSVEFVIGFEEKGRGGGCICVEVGGCEKFGFLVEV